MKFTQYIHQMRRKEFYKVFGNRKYGGKCLELGSGDGYLYKHYKKKFKKVTLTEPNKYVANKNTIICHAEQLPFKDNSFDYIVSFHVFEHILDIERAMEECNRVIKPKGKMFHILPNQNYKIMHLMLYYPAAIRTILKASERKRLKKRLYDDNLNVKAWYDYIFPIIHGNYMTHYDEYRMYHKDVWIRFFQSHGYKVKHRNLTFRSGYGFNMPKLRKIIGKYIQTSHVFILS